MNDEQQSTHSDRLNRPDAVERYLAGEAAGDDAAVFARCDAVMALTPKLAGSADALWAFDEARALARRDPRGRNDSTPSLSSPRRWLQNPGIAWGAASILAVALVFALQSRDGTESAFDGSVVGTRGADPTGPSAQQEQMAARLPAVQNLMFAPIVISTELAQTLAEVRPV
jgi:hypothetical protein